MNKQSFIRSAEFQLRDDGRTLEGCIVPYNEPADVVDMTDDGELVRYREQFLPHSLYNMAQGFQARSGKGMNVPLLIDHEESMERLVGFATNIESRDDGAYGTFRLYDDANIVKVRSILSESHTGLSVKFRDIREPKLIDEIVSRVQVYVAHVAATPIPAYAGAAIGSIRNNGEPVTAPTPTLDEVREWLAKQRESVS
jgi:phage head maturation protease